MLRKQEKPDGDVETKGSEKHLATKSEYLGMLEDRPEKFTPEEVNFREALDGEPPCASCIHWFYGPIRNTAVCEVVRNEIEHIPAHFTCNFHTTDGENYPLLESSE